MWKNKVYGVINVVGLSIAFGVCLLLFITAAHEFSYDGFHAGKDNIYRLYLQKNHASKVEKQGFLAAPMAPALLMEYKDIKRLVRMNRGDCVIRYREKELAEQIKFVDSSFFQFFSFPLIQGKPESILRSLNEVVLTESMARNVFGSEPPVGKQVQLKIGEQWQNYTVSGIAADSPDNSSIQFFVLVRFENNPGYQDIKDTWNNSFLRVYVQLTDDADAAGFEKKLQPFTRKYFADQIQGLKSEGASPDERGEVLSTRLLPLSKLHFDSEAGGDSIPAINRTFPYMLLLVSLFILLIAVINFVNLSIARSLTRAREVGMRKVLGAGKAQVMGQFWGEALIICSAALLAGTCVAFSLLPAYKALYGSSLSLRVLGDPLLIALMILGFLLITLIAGGYPAWLITRFNTIEVLKGKIQVNRKNSLQDLLVTIQFAVATLLIGCTLIALRQIDYLRNKPLGFEEQHVVSIPVSKELDGSKTLETFRQRLRQNVRVLSVSGAGDNLGAGLDGPSMHALVGFDYKGRGVLAHWLRIDYDYLKTLDIQLLEGRDFAPNRPADITNSVIINEAMAKQLGENKAAGALLQVNDEEPPMQVIGVIKDFHFQSLRSSIEPLILHVNPAEGINYLFVKVAPSNLPATVDLLKNTWNEIAPNAEFKASFLDENTDRQYQREERLSNIFLSSAVLAIFISCIGLFAMTVIIMAQRTKEVGIRKLHGATLPHLVLLLSKNFLRYIGIAFIIATPVTWYAMNYWLTDFIYRIQISIWLLIVAGLLVMIIAVLTMSSQVIRAALAKPIDALRND